MSLGPSPSFRRRRASELALAPVRTAMLGLFLLALSAVEVVGQSPVLPRQVARGLPTFEVRVQPGPVLGASEGEGELGAVPWMACATPTGPFYAATMSRPGRLIRFEGDGTASAAFGQRGRGPGEFLSIYPLEFADGRLFAFDGVNRRLTVLTGDLVVARMTPLPGPPGKAIAVTGDSLLLAGEISTAERIGLPLHLVDPAGRLVRSFGAIAPVRRADQPYATTRRVAPARAGGVWAAHFTRYQIERWSMAGALQEEFRVATPWFAAWDTPVDGVSRPTIVDIQEDRDGYLWVLVRLSREAGPDGAAPAGGARFETVIEVIDPRTAQVVASRRVDAELREFACERTSYRERTDADGFMFVEVWRLGLERMGGRGPG